MLLSGARMVQETRQTAKAAELCLAGQILAVVASSCRPPQHLPGRLCWHGMSAASPYSLCTTAERGVQKLVMKRRCCCCCSCTMADSVLSPQRKGTLTAAAGGQALEQYTGCQILSVGARLTNPTGNLIAGCWQRYPHTKLRRAGGPVKGAAVGGGASTGASTDRSCVRARG